MDDDSLIKLQRINKEYDEAWKNDYTELFTVRDIFTDGTQVVIEYSQYGTLNFIVQPFKSNRTLRMAFIDADNLVTKKDYPIRKIETVNVAE